MSTQATEGLTSMDNNSPGSNSPDNQSAPKHTNDQLLAYLLQNPLQIVSLCLLAVGSAIFVKYYLGIEYLPTQNLSSLTQLLFAAALVFVTFSLLPALFLSLMVLVWSSPFEAAKKCPKYINGKVSKEALFFKLVALPVLLWFSFLLLFFLWAKFLHPNNVALIVGFVSFFILVTVIIAIDRYCNLQFFFDRYWHPKLSLDPQCVFGGLFKYYFKVFSSNILPEIMVLFALGINLYIVLLFGEIWSFGLFEVACWFFIATLFQLALARLYFAPDSPELRGRKGKFLLFAGSYFLILLGLLLFTKLPTSILTGFRLVNVKTQTITFEKQGCAVLDALGVGLVPRNRNQDDICSLRGAVIVSRLGPEYLLEVQSDAEAPLDNKGDVKIKRDVERRKIQFVIPAKKVISWSSLPQTEDQK